MRKFTLSFTLSVGMLLVGCAMPLALTPRPETTTPLAQPAYGKGDLVLRLRMGDSQTILAGGSPMFVYQSGDIDKLVLTPRLKVGENYVPLSTQGGTTTEGATDQLKIEFDDVHDRQWFVLKNLAPDSSYRITAQAYDDQGKLISKDEESFSDVELIKNEHAHMADIPLRLVDKVFSATAKARVTFNGDLGATDHVVLTLWKKGTPDDQVGGPITLSKAEVSAGYSIALGGLRHETTYVLKAEAQDTGNNKLTEGQVEWEITNDTALEQKDLVLALGATVSTYAGGGADVNVGEVDLADAKFAGPYGIVQRGGKIYVSDYNSHQIRMIDPQTGKVSIFSSADQATGLVFDSSGNLFFVISNRHKIAKIPVGGAPEVFAGPAGYYTFSVGQADGSATEARFSGPAGLAIDTADNLYVADSGNHRIRMITKSGVVSTLAGSDQGMENAVGTAAKFSSPVGLAIDSANNLYVADRGNHSIRKIALGDKTVTTVADAADGLNSPRSLAVGIDGTTLFVTDEHRVLQIKDGAVTILAGTTGRGFSNDPGANARFDYPTGILQLSDGTLLVVDTSNGLIRQVQLP